MNGKEWRPEHTTTLEAWAGRMSDAEIGLLTGHAAVTIKRRRRTMGLPALADKRRWSRRDYLLAASSGLDFVISN